jgi:hypothetical protein
MSAAVILVANVEQSSESLGGDKRRVGAEPGCGTYLRETHSGDEDDGECLDDENGYKREWMYDCQRDGGRGEVEKRSTTEVLFICGKKHVKRYCQRTLAWVVVSIDTRP